MQGRAWPEGESAAYCGILRRTTRTTCAEESRSGSSPACRAATCISPRTAKCASSRPQTSWHSRSGVLEHSTTRAPAAGRGCWSPRDRVARPRGCPPAGTPPHAPAGRRCGADDPPRWGRPCSGRSRPAARPRQCLGPRGSRRLPLIRQSRSPPARQWRSWRVQQPETTPSLISHRSATAPVPIRVHNIPPHSIHAHVMAHAGEPDVDQATCRPSVSC